MVYAQKNAPTYTKNSTVLVNVPEGNFDREKTIIGEVIDKNSKYNLNIASNNFVSLPDDSSSDWKTNQILVSFNLKIDPSQSFFDAPSHLGCFGALKMQ